MQKNGAGNGSVHRRLIVDTCAYEERVVRETEAKNKAHCLL